MKTYTLKILFLISATRKNKKGLVPLICRITHEGKRKQFATGLFINPDYWHSKQQVAKPPNEENNFINTQISLIKQKINQAFLFLQVNQPNFDAEDIYLLYLGENTKLSKTLLEVFEMHNSRMEKLIGIEYTQSTYNKFVQVKIHTTAFIKFQYKKSDILLESIKMNFLRDFDFYLKTEKKQKQITINKNIQRVRKIVKLALAEGYLQKDPFLLYKPKRHEKKITYLTVDELKSLEEHQFAQSRLEQIRDMFAFCCYTGLAYAEMDSLSKEHLIKEFDGQLWIKMYRQKTKSSVSIPLLPKSVNIIEKYKNEDEVFVLPRISNQRFNSYLKEIAAIISIKKRLTHHMARKTFATTVLLYNDVPMEIVSELLGHSSIKITQGHYAKVVQKKVSEHVLKLGERLNKK